MDSFYADYTQYLKSDAWQEKRLQRMAIDGGRCQFCGSRGTADNPLETHHFNYRNLFHEDIYKDIVTACRSCHKMIHCGMNRVTSEEGRRGWQNDLPQHIRDSLRERGLT